MTGSHATKFGVAVSQGRRRTLAQWTGDISALTFNNGVSTSVTERIATEAREGIRADAGIYAQDRWTINRATINAGSAAFRLPPSASRASVTLNAGSAKVCLPSGTPVRVSWSGTIASNNFDSVGLVRQDDDHWITAGAVSSAVDLNISANAGSFTLVFGGSCHA
ncbi:MAG: hypothetical protein HY264_01190 [Chloroflexi bacterium]|nr:hypothetical protein [Chloroflexota bacterium]